MKTGIVVALAEELRTLTTRRLKKGECHAIGDGILVAYAGAGGNNAQQAAELLCAQGVGRLISWGCAAALNPELKSGDLTLADALLDANLTPLNIASSWHMQTKNRLAELLPVHCGTLLESKTIVAASSDKQQLYQRSNALVLDMESVAVAKVAQANGLPFLAIRAIVDPVTLDLPPAVSYAMNPQGELSLARLLWFLLQHPQQLNTLINLGLHFEAAKKTLKIVASQLDAIVAAD